MEVFTIVLSIFGGLGIGAALNSVVQHRLRQNSDVGQRLYNEKRDSYIGLLQSLHDAAVHPSDENSKAYALWQTRVSLFGSSDVAKAASDIAESAPGSTERRRAFDSLVEAMRQDLR